MKISEIRKAADVTQQQMATEINVAIRTISCWETRELTIGELSIQGRQAVKQFAKKHNIKLEDCPFETMQ
jgi:transcriptional regulator with XRE-family HTH domain